MSYQNYDISSSRLPPRLSTRLSLSMHGREMSTISELVASRKRLLTELENADVTSSLSLDQFLYPSITPEENQRTKRAYMSFLEDVAAIEGDNVHPNAAKTMYMILARHALTPSTGDDSTAASITPSSPVYREATSYFGHIDMRRFEQVCRLGEELRQYAARNRSGTMVDSEFGRNIRIDEPIVQFAPGFDSYVTLFDDEAVHVVLSTPVTPPPLATVASTTNTSARAVLRRDTPKDTAASNTNDLLWLEELCVQHMGEGAVEEQASGLFEDIPALARQMIKLCQEHGADGDGGDGMLETVLFDLLGEGGFALMLDVVQQRGRIKSIALSPGTSSASSASASASAAGQAPPSVSEAYTCTTAGSGTNSSGGGNFLSPWESTAVAAGTSTCTNTGASMQQRTEQLSANQRRKREQKEAKEMEQALQASHAEAMSSSSVAQTGSATASGAGGGGAGDWLKQLGFDDEYLLTERALGLQKGRNHAAMPEHWMEGLAAQGSTAAEGGEAATKRGLPPGAERTTGQGFEEVHIPAARPKHQQDQDALINVAEVLDPWAQKAFAGTKRLNRIQSKVFPTAYHSAENMLVCAPTGAGKTNIAMLCLLQLVKMHTDAVTGAVDRAAIKAVYIAPMKALAQEVVAKFSERLAPLGLVVREFTGDMQLTRQEVADSQLLVSTPEKYDVVTRKGGDGSLGTMVSLILIDEIHLLADERGAVIETIVARTHRYIESSQQMVRIVGLSATLPNYQDVATFLRVNPSTGLYFFGPEFRPIPLDQTFLGVTEKQRVKRNDVMNKLAYDKMVQALQRGKQVMIFVHARKETSKTAEALADLSGKYGTTDLLENVHHEKYTLWKRQVDKSRSREVQQLFAKGLGVHHAGMLRADRSMTEQLFELGVVKVLVCTATLAWGINLPAHTVVIKGTELYDPERGGFVDLSILDVFQIFGRAGRPQYDTSGHAILITPHKSLASYLGMLTHQAPIESALVKALADHLNAEIVNGTINNIKEAASWLSYTFLFVRMCKNPIAYGINREDLYADPRLEAKRVQLVRDAAELLDNCMMARYDRRSGNLAVTNLGRIASHYYIKHDTIEAFNTMLAPHLSDPDALHVLCSSAEFDQLKVRPEELNEIDAMKKHTVVPLRSSTDDTSGKVNVLLQGYLAKNAVNSFTLQSDTNYVAQNAGRIARALFEICLKRGWSSMAGHYLSLCKGIDRRMLPSQTPLRQFNDLPKEVIQRLEDTEATADRLKDMSAREIGQLIHNQKLGARVLALARQLPFLHIETFIQPITRGILRLVLTMHVDFVWSDRYHGFSEPFWVLVEDGESEYIYHAENVVISKREQKEARTLEVTIPVREPLPPQYYVRCISDTWVGCERLVTVSFRDLVLPSMEPTHTDLLPVHPVPRSALGNPAYEALYPHFTHFNPVQSQLFHTLYHTDTNVLVGAPTGSGKTITGELAILRLLNQHPDAKIVYVAPLKALARERLNDWQRKLGGGGGGGGGGGARGGARGGAGLGLRIMELTGDVTPTLEELNRSNILIVTPEKWDSISRGWQRRSYVQKVQLVIIDEIHLLGVDRGPVLEVIVSRMRFIATQTATPVRFVGLSTALANPRDLADWLGIGEVGVYNFRSSVRPIPMTTHIQGFPGKHYCPRMATMNKPAYAAILEHSPTKPALIFVSSRRQTRLTALDLIAYCASDENPKQFLHMPEEEVTAIAATLQDRALRDTIVFGVALHHAGLQNHDRSVVEELFFAGKLQVLVCTSTLAWGVNLPCHLVIVKGTEFYDAKQCRYVDMPVTDVLQMMGRAGRPQFDDTGVACIFVHEPKKTFYKKFLHEPFPVESSLHLHLQDHLNAEIASGSLHNVQDCIEYLTWTYYFRRLLMNPAYYGLVQDSQPQGEDGEDEEEDGDAEPRGSNGAEVSASAIEAHLTNLVLSVANDLYEAGCIDVSNGEGNKDDDERNKMEDKLTARCNFSTTYLGKIASVYYLRYQTVGRIRERLYELDDEDMAHEEEDQQQEGVGHSIYYYRYQLWSLLLVLCDCPEFSELPVRHNEEHLNLQLAQELSELQVNRSGPAMTTQSVEGADSVLDFVRRFSSFESPHAKAFLLLLAHMEGAPLPISDYINDTKTVVDQVARVSKAMLDIAGEEGLFGIVLRLTHLSQLIAQGISIPVDPSSASFRAHELHQLPHVNMEVASHFAVKGRVQSLHQLLQLPQSRVNQLAANCLQSRSDSGGSNAVADFMRCLSNLPDFEVEKIEIEQQVESSQGSSGAGAANVAELGLYRYQYPSNSSNSNSSTTTTPCSTFPQLERDTRYKLSVVFRCRHGHPAGASVYTKKGRQYQKGGGGGGGGGRRSKPAAGWMLLLGLRDSTSRSSTAETATGAGTAGSTPLNNIYYTELASVESISSSGGELLALKQISFSASSSSTGSSCCGGGPQQQQGQEWREELIFQLPSAAEDTHTGGSGNEEPQKELITVLSSDTMCGLNVAVKLPVLFSL